MRLRPIVFVVTLVAGMLVIAAPPAAAEDSGCGSIRGDVQDISTIPGTILDAFFVDSNCDDTFDATETAQGTSDAGGEGTATASQRYVLTFAPQGLMTSADALGSLSTSTSGAQIFAGADNSLQLRFTIPQGATGSVSAAVNAAGNGESGGGGAFVEFQCEDGTDELASVRVEGGIPPSANDSFSVGGVGPGECGVLASAALGTADGSDMSADFDVTVTVGESQCDNEFTDGADIITGTPDDDLLCGGGGNDSIDGAGGNDIITGGAGSDSITGGDGLDTIDGGEGDDFIEGGPLRDIISGGPGNDGDDTAPISGGGGPDDIDGGDGIDHISGGDDNDTIDGGPGLFDFLEGDLGDDTIDGGGATQFDSLHGCNDTDPLCDANQADLDAAGVTDKDILRVTGQGGSLIKGGSAKDNLFGDAGSDELHGGRGDDFIDGGGDRDLLFGDQGDDFLLGGPGHESGTSPAGDPRAIFGGPGDDDIFGGPGDDLMEGEAGKDELLGAAGSDKLRGQDGNDCLTGGARKDVLAGGPGNDRLFARDGVHDVANGGPQFDRARVDGVDRLIRIENDNFQGGCP